VELKLGINVGYWQRDPDDQTETVLAAERLGYDAVFTAEAYGSDAFTTLTWYAARTSKIKLGTAVAQMSARTPVATAMHALTLDALSGGRVILGVGASGPQVVEGWYGVPFPTPLARTREYLDIMRQVWRREAPVTNTGPHYPLPYPGGTGLGKPLKSIVHPVRPEIPVYLGAEGPKNVALSAEGVEYVFGRQRGVHGRHLRAVDRQGRRGLGDARARRDQPAVRRGRRDHQQHAGRGDLGAGRPGPHLQGVAPDRRPGVAVPADHQVGRAGADRAGAAGDGAQGVQDRADRTARRRLPGDPRGRGGGRGAGRPRPAAGELRRGRHPGRHLPFAARAHRRGAPALRRQRHRP
jgi:alkanesulfonate monooxygenase SsuD/methylene tetrahydromethanopterin reductase-like flavin-dependent oxidoreductase (luciferase family)